MPMTITLPAKSNLYAITPDGTVYAFVNAVLECQSLAGTTWQPLATFTNTQTTFQSIAGLSWDSLGHPIAVWAIAATYSTAPLSPIPVSQVLAYHAAACGA